MNFAIAVENLGKKYIIGHLKQGGSLRDAMTQSFAGLKGVFGGNNGHRHSSNKEEFWALKDVSFEVEQGDRVGIIGRNGAGKSTLLKIISRITEPTQGRIKINGRVASLLEVGTGFHPELTGRENIYLNGAILGMSKVEIKRKFEEIIEFAEVEKFLDTPVKRYSSGMYVRLAFAVAAHLEPEILIVDEVLAVGDAQFQKKCLGKMGSVASEGRTVVFVSHNLAGLVQQLCNKGILLVGGRGEFTGSASDAIARYTEEHISHTGEVRFAPRAVKAGMGAIVRFTQARLLKDGVVNNTFFIGDSLTLEADLEFSERFRAVQLTFVVRSATEGNIYHCCTRDAGLEAMDLCGSVRFSATIDRLALYPGEYFIDKLWVATLDEMPYDYVTDVLSFVVAEGGPCVSRRLDRQLGVVYEVPTWKLMTESSDRDLARGQSGTC